MGFELCFFFKLTNMKKEEEEGVLWQRFAEVQCYLWIIIIAEIKNKKK